LDLRFINQNVLHSFGLISGEKISGAVSAEVNHKRSTSYCVGKVKPSFLESFRALIWSISEKNGQTDIFYDFYRTHYGK